MQEHLFSSAEREEPINGGLYFSYTWRAAALQPDSDFGNLKRHPERHTFKCIFWPNSSFYSDDD